MQIRKRLDHRLSVATLIGVCLIASNGCQSWQSSAALPGLVSGSGERQVLREAKNDPFPSPSEVGIQVAK
jgi:hypothetical protein